MIVVCIWITAIILKVSEVGCGTHDSKKLRAISLCTFQKILLKIQNFKILAVLMKIQNSKKIKLK
jgi:hypothetical protein